MGNHAELLDNRGDVYHDYHVYTALEIGILDCVVTWAGIGHYWRLHEVADYIIGPLLSFSFSPNVINGEEWRDIPHDLQQKIIIEEAAKSELEALRLAAIQSELGLIKNINAGLNHLPFSDEIKARSRDVAISSVVPNWIDRVGDPAHPIIADIFNKKIGPIVGLRVHRNGFLVETN